jgi:putative flippase GtrA
VTETRAEHLRTLVRFGLVGGGNSLLHAAVVLGLGALTGGHTGWVLVLVGWIVCIPIGYVTQARLVWRRPLAWSGLAKISISQVPSATISTAAAAVGGSLGFPLVAQEAMALVTGAVISYVLQRFWVFRAPAP